MAGWSYNPQSYQDELKKAKASIPQAAQPKTPGAIPGMGYGQVVAASQAQAPAKPVIPQAAPQATPGNPAISQGMAAAYAAPKPAGAIPPAYGSNVTGFDANNQDHVKIADAGQAWATAKAAGDTAGMSAAAALGQQLRSGAIPNTYDAKKGVTTFQTPVPAGTISVSGPTPPVTPNVATPDAVTNVRSSDELQQSAGDQNAIERAALDTAVRERLTSLKNGAEYSNKLIQDNRVLENAQMDRTLTPFSGRTSYDKAMVNRGRGIDDSARAAELSNKLGATQEELFNFDKLAPERQRQIYNESLKYERDFGLNQAQVTGNYGGQRTLAGQAQDWGRTVDEANLTGTFGGKKTAAQANTEWQQRFGYGQATGTFNNGQQTLENKKFQYTQGRDKVADEQWEQEYNRRVEQDGIQNAISWANNSLSEDDNARQWVETDARLSGSEAPKYDGMSASQVVSTLQSQLYDSYGDLKPNVTKEQIYRSIVEYGLPDGQDDQAMLSLGLSRADITSFDKQFGVSSGN